MNTFFRVRGLLALIVAYAVAVQGVLLPMAASASFLTEAALCAAEKGSPTPARQDHGLDCPCATVCAAQGLAAAAPPAAAVAIEPPREFAGHLVSAGVFEIARVTAPYLPHFPRAPPFA